PPPSPQRLHLSAPACRTRRYNGGAPRPLCLHRGLGAPPLYRLAPRAPAVVSGISRGLGTRPIPAAGQRLPVASDCLTRPAQGPLTPCDRDHLPREVRSHQRIRQQRMSLIIV